jgi:hypothetical protein
MWHTSSNKTVQVTLLTRWERFARFEPATRAHVITSDNSKHVLHSPTLNCSLDKLSAVYIWITNIYRYLISIVELTWLLPLLVLLPFIYKTFISSALPNAESILSIRVHYWTHVIVASSCPSLPWQVWDVHILRAHECRKHTYNTLLGSRDYYFSVYFYLSNHRRRHCMYILIYNWPWTRYPAKEIRLNGNAGFEKTDSLYSVPTV